MTEADGAGPDALEILEPLVGVWAVSGPEIKGRVVYEWMEGGGFLVQKVELDHGKNKHTGVEYIGYDEEGGTLKSHYFDGAGMILEYTYEVRDDKLTIWFGDTGSEAKYEGRFTDGGDTNAGRWTWPGGGYESSMTRVGG